MQIKILDPKVSLPAHATTGSAGVDLRVCMDTPEYTLQPGESRLFSTGLSVYIQDPKYAGFVIPRSGLGSKLGVVLGNLTGLIDSDYQGPLMVCLWNRSSEPRLITDLDRVAQLVIVPVVQVTWEVVTDFVQTDRGTSGFGSTGV